MSDVRTAGREDLEISDFPPVSSAFLVAGPGPGLSIAGTAAGYASGAGGGRKLKAAVLGATGVVGQRFVRRLADHPHFELVALAASERSVGKTYREACHWHLDGEEFAGFGDRIILACSPEAFSADIVFSALDTEPARSIEPAFAAAGAFVFSNASTFRMDEDVPLLIPEVNASHLGMLERQRAKRGWPGAIITNPNCTTVVLAGALAPLERAFGIEAVMMTSMQAISGAGYPGVSALDIAGNVIPLIRGEEPKVETEACKILGLLAGKDESARWQPAGFPVSATCTRVPVNEGHTIAVSVKLRGNPGVDEVKAAISAFVPDTAGLHLHSAPRHFVTVTDSPDRPQPRRDVELDKGMRISIGRVRTCPILGIKFIALGHNTERGAAGDSVLNAELAYAKEVIRWA